MASHAQAQIQIPRIAIKFCVQCKWNLRAAYYAQELLQTFSTAISEVALLPVTGGVFTVTIYHHQSPTTAAAASTDSDSTQATATVVETLLWDRKAEGGFPETKELKNRVRNVIEPDRDLGHIDRSLKKGKGGATAKEVAEDKTTAASAATSVISGTTAAGDPPVAPEALPAAKDDCKDCP